MMMRYGGGFGWMGILFPVVFVVCSVAVVVVLVQYAGKFWGNDEALTLLRKKYANGEISQKEYLEKKEDLTH